MEAWDFFIAYTRPDEKAADRLYGLLSSAGARVFMDRRRLEPGQPWDSALKKALTRSAISVFLISSDSEDSYYQQEEVAIASGLARDPKTLQVCVPVLLSGTEQRDIPYGLNRLSALKEDGSSLEDVAQALLRMLRERHAKPSTVMLARSAELLDEIWAGAEPAFTGGVARTPDEFRERYAAEGSDLVATHRGQAFKRVTRADLDRLLTSDELEYVETLERSMAFNLALWRERYPTRTTNPSNRRKVEEAVGAMAEDLEGVLQMLERAGFHLDDHYMGVRAAVQRLRSPSAPG